MKQATHHRKGSTIHEIESGKNTAYDSINAAKRASRVLQKGQLGYGAVRVVEKLPA